jgi:hypothetical protein
MRGFRLGLRSGVVGGRHLVFRAAERGKGIHNTLVCDLRSRHYRPVTLSMAGHSLDNWCRGAAIRAFEILEHRIGVRPAGGVLLAAAIDPEGRDLMCSFANALLLSPCCNTPQFLYF